MDWLWLAFLAPLLYAMSGFIDKYAISKVVANMSAGAMLIFSSICSVPLAIIFAFVAWGDIIAISLHDSILAFIAGCLEMIGWYFYYKALRKTDASFIIALSQMSILFTYLLGAIFLHETLNAPTIFALGLVGFGVMLLNLEMTEGRWRFNGKILGLMAASTFLIGLTAVILKTTALESSFWAAQFYAYLATCAVGIVLWYIPSARKNFLLTMQRKKAPTVLALNIANEAIYLGGALIANYAMLLGSVAVVQAIVSVQSVYMIGIGVLVTWLAPHILTENMSHKRLLQKAFCILAIVAGSVMLSFN